MKYKTTIIIALVVIVFGIFVSLSFFPTEAQKRKATRVQYNTGIIPLGPNQKVRVTVLNRGTETLNVQVSYRHAGTGNDQYCLTPNYQEGTIFTCMLGNPDNSPIIPVLAGQAVSQERSGEAHNNFVIFVDGQNPVENVVVTTSIINSDNGAVQYSVDGGFPYRNIKFEPSN